MTEEDIWEGDLLGRKEEGKYLQRYIENLYKLDKKDQTSFVLNINSEWGFGKTWFLKRLKDELAKNNPVVYFDAWKNDFSKDALLSFVSVICDELSKLYWKKGSVVRKVSKVKSAFSLISKNALPVLAAVLAKQLTGKALEDVDLSDDVKETFADASEQLSKVVSTSMIDGFITQKNAIDDFSNAIQSLVSEIENDKDLHLPICIMVDELDRCRPTYAIELLESIKHLFAVKGLFFILATDTTQLGHSIKAIYGEGFNSNFYLKRFFYAEYKLVSPDYDKVANYLFNNSKIGERLLLPSSFSHLGLKGMFALIAKFFKLSIRDQEQVFSTLETIMLTSEKNTMHFIVLVFLICLRHKFLDDYNKFFYRSHTLVILDYLHNKIAESELKEIPFTGRAWKEGKPISEEYTLSYLLETYFNFLQMPPGELQYRPNNEGFDWINNVSQQILISDSSGVIEYFHLVNQSGQIER